MFLSFTLSQSGMVIHWWRERERDRQWLTHAIVNGVDASATGLVLLVIGLTKFTHGAWMVIVLIPIVVMMFRAVHSHYAEVAENLRLPHDLEEPEPIHHTIVIPVAGLHRAVVQTVSYARTLSADVRAVHIATDNGTAQKLKVRWERWNPGVPLEIIHSPYRSLSGAKGKARCGHRDGAGVCAQALVASPAA